MNFDYRMVNQKRAFPVIIKQLQLNDKLINYTVVIEEQLVDNVSFMVSVLEDMVEQTK
jgi:hypothetical protein